MNSRLFIPCIFVVLSGPFAAPAARGQTNVQISEFELTPAQVRLVVAHPLAGSTNFTLQASTLSNAWSAVPGGMVRGLDLGRIEFTAPRPANPFQFFRILGVVATNDLDADGLPGPVETALGTNPGLTDTDGDGYSDGHEMIAGTDPLDAGSFPTQSNLPVVTFNASVSQANEGAGTHTVGLTFDRPYFGNLSYTVNARSTAAAGADYAPLSGSVLVMGTTASIAVTPRDDLLIKPVRSLMLDLAGDGLGYRIGIRSTHVVSLTDDDAYWNGALRDAYAERNFRVSIARSNSITQVCFVAGAGFDGLPVLTNEAPGSATSLSEGIIPAGCTNATVLSDTSARFEVLSPSLPAEGGDLFSGGDPLARTFTLLIATNDPGNVITTRLMAGSYTERIGIAGTTGSHLDRTNSGVLALARDIPLAPPLTNGVVTP